MNWYQHFIELRARRRGFHLVTDDIISQLPELKKINTGLLHLFIQHTSASLTINENADPSVRADVEAHFNQFVPENARYYQHTMEGSDDMPAHIKAVTIGNTCLCRFIMDDLLLAPGKVFISESTVITEAPGVS